MTPELQCSFCSRSEAQVRGAWQRMRARIGALVRGRHSQSLRRVEIKSPARDAADIFTA